MTPEQKRIVILEDALIQAYHTVSFLHSCLTDEKFSYGFPEQSISELDRWSQIVAIPASCCHSGIEDDCEVCQDALRRHKLLVEAKEPSDD